MVAKAVWSQAIMIRQWMASSSLAKIASFLLVLLLSWQGGAWLAQGFDKFSSPVLPELQMATSNNSIVAYGINLWGVPDRAQPKEVAPVVSKNIQDTRLSLTLLGVIKQAEHSVAIIERGRESLVLTVGELVQPNVSLIEIGNDYVVLLHRGKHERLAMEDRAGGLITGEVKPVDDLSLSSAEQQRLQQINSEIRENPMRMGNYVRFKGVKKNDAWVGIEVSPRREHKIFEAMGLKPGDLIKSINGTQIQELADAPTLWNRFLQESRFDLQVERNGLLETISVDLTNITE
ncbi:MAG: type II secretion system protein GspC [Methyloprofundus sp.]|nr:type II secretion system protein GspC [Methyloprofundus sp.]